MTNMLDSLWVEKYRPKHLKEVVLPEEQKKFLEDCVIKNDIPHLLFVGSAGSGKSTVARILVDNLIKHEMDVLLLNGSDTTGVDTIRSEVQGFLKTPPFASKLKIVYIDEFDYMTSNAQAALRNIMEKYADNGRFICTGNYITKIIDPLQSRFQIFEMSTIKEDFATEYCENILEMEEVKYDKKSLKLIVSNLVPDVRKIVNTIQKNVVDKKLKKIDVNSVISIEKKIGGMIMQICDSIKDGKGHNIANQHIPEILKIVADNTIDFRHIYQILSDSEGFPLWGKIKLNQYSNTHQGAAVPYVHFMACVYDVIQTGLIYYKTFKS